MKSLDVRIKQINRVAGRRKSCMYDMLKTISRYHNFNLEYIYIDQFHFDFNYCEYEKNDLLGRALHQRSDSALKNLENFYGIKLETCYFENFDQEYSYIRTSLENNTPAIIHFDSFNLPWDPFYNKIHNEHILLVTGIINNSFYIVDPYFNKSREILSIESVKKSSQFFMYLKKFENRKPIPTFNSLIKKYYGNIQKNPSNSYINLEFFGKTFLTRFDKKKEFVEFFFDQNTIFQNLSTCILRVLLFYELIEYQSFLEESQLLLLMKEELIEIINVWNNIISLIAMKKYKDISNRMISELISSLSYKYETVYNHIDKYINKIERG